MIGRQVGKFVFAMVLLVSILVKNRFRGLVSCESVSREDMSDEYDFVIVGGGTAGAALASELSKRLPHMKTLLLEAGGCTNTGLSTQSIPLLSSRIPHSKIDWQYQMEPYVFLLL
jgi:hypothetical protein